MVGLQSQNASGRIFESVKSRYPAIFEKNDEIRLNPRSLAYVVGELQRYSFLNTNIDVKGKAYEELVGANLRGNRGEFFTPRNVQRMAIEMLDIQLEEKMLDPACGTRRIFSDRDERDDPSFKGRDGGKWCQSRRNARRANRSDTGSRPQLFFRH